MGDSVQTTRFGVQSLGRNATTLREPARLKSLGDAKDGARAAIRRQVGTAVGDERQAKELARRFGLSLKRHDVDARNLYYTLRRRINRKECEIGRWTPSTHEVLIDGHRAGRKCDTLLGAIEYVGSAMQNAQACQKAEPSDCRGKWSSKVTVLRRGTKKPKRPGATAYGQPVPRATPAHIPPAAVVQKVLDALLILDDECLHAIRKQWIEAGMDGANVVLEASALYKKATT